VVRLDRPAATVVRPPPLAQSLSLPRLESVTRGITPLSERKPDPFHDDIMDFGSLFIGNLAQCFVDRFGQI